jgi:hypothetical protein
VHQETKPFPNCAGSKKRRATKKPGRQGHPGFIGLISMGCVFRGSSPRR